MTSTETDGAVPEDRDPLDIAAEWHMCMSSRNVTAEQQAAFAAWHADPDNASLYAEYEAIWGLMQGVVAQPGKVVPFTPPPRKRLLSGPRAMAIAASLLLAIGLGYQYQHVWRFDVVADGNQIVARQLADGSRLMLTPGTAIDTDFSDGKRRITLARGEVYFDVFHDPQRPFVIDAGSAEVRVLGTAFTVGRDGDAGAVVVQRGKVRVQAGDVSNDLTPNQRIEFAANSEGPVQQVQAAKALAWTQGRLIFENQPLGTVLKAVAPYYSNRIIVLDGAIARRRVDASIDISQIDSWLMALNRTQRLTILRMPGFILLR
jgi:transmembrane sensor